MSGDPPPMSGSPYIIICSGRADIAAAKKSDEIALAATRAAGQFAAYMGIRYRVSMVPAHMRPISDLQHELMAFLLGDVNLSKQEVQAKADQIVAEMYILEQTYTGVNY